MMDNLSRRTQRITIRGMIKLRSHYPDSSPAFRCVLRDLCAKFLAPALVAILLIGASSRDKKVDVSKIYGRIEFVKSFPDYKVKAVKSFPDLRVEIVESFPTSAGKWEIVDSFPDYKIEMVDSFPDFTVEFVKSFPGPTK